MLQWEAVDTYRPLGAVAIAVLIAGLLFLVMRWPQGKHATFSQHAAAYRHTVVYYNLLFTIVLPLLLLFFAGWFAPYFGLSVWFTVFLFASAICQYIVTLIPETGGWKTQWHRYITFSSVLLLFPALILMIFSPTFNLASKLVMCVALGAMLGIVVYIAAVRGQHKALLLFQAGYYAAFFIPILLVAYA